jgi:hypothetical protein
LQKHHLSTNIYSHRYYRNALYNKINCLTFAKHFIYNSIITCYLMHLFAVAACVGVTAAAAEAAFATTGYFATRCGTAYSGTFTSAVRSAAVAAV